MVLAVSALQYLEKSRNKYLRTNTTFMRKEEDSLNEQQASIKKLKTKLSLRAKKAMNLRKRARRHTLLELRKV